MFLQYRDNVGFGKIEAKGAHRHFQFMVVDALIFVKVEESKLLKSAMCLLCLSMVQRLYGLVDLFPLLLGQLIHEILGFPLPLLFQAFAL